MKNVSRKIIAHDFTKEFKDLEYEVKFNITGTRLNSLVCLKAIETCFAGNTRFLLYKIKGGDKLVTRSTFLTKGAEEYSFFKYRGAKMLKVKQHHILKTKPFRVFANSERLLIDRKDFSKKLSRFRRRFRRHNYVCINWEPRMKQVLSGAEYAGDMIKTRVKDFVLDARDGRIYAVAVTFCRSKNKVQKQCEIEYSGYVSSFRGFRKNSRKQMLSGLLAVSAHIYSCLPRILAPSVERKFSFVKKAYAK